MGRKILIICSLLILAVSITCISRLSDRSDFITLLALFTIAFVPYLFILKAKFLRTKEIMGLAIFLRLICLFSEPQLSDDYYRFLWDGLVQNHNASLVFSQTPQQLMDSELDIPGINAELYQKINSPDYFSVYPPVCQWIWGCIAHITGPDPSLFSTLLKCLMVFVEILTLLFLTAILKTLQKPPSLVAVYALNPLVIIELSGNLHPEGFMILFLVLSLYAILKLKSAGEQGKRNGKLYFLIAAFSFSLAVSTKLIPLMFLPLFIPLLGWKKAFVFGAVVLILSTLSFLPFYPNGVNTGILYSLELYFRQFEFNASLYYIIREFAFLIRGHNEIDWIGPLLSSIPFLFIMLISMVPRLKMEFFLSLLLAYVVYLFCSTTVHPWYLALPICFSVFVPLRFVIWWSLLIVLSYSHYREIPWTENYAFIISEYLLLFCFIFYEAFQWRQKKLGQSQVVSH